jgi:hypothetical protein
MMRNLLCLLLSLLSLGVAGQFTDDFSDGDFTQNPTWSGMTADFEVLGGQLHLNAPAVASQSFLSTSSQASIDASWEFYIRMAFNPSSSNYAEVHLLSASPDLQQSSSTYYLRIGGGTQDRISLYKKMGGAAILIAESSDGWVGLNNNTVRIRATRSGNAVWTVEADSTGGSNFVSLFGAVDSSIVSGSFFGVRCIYTATRSDLFYFDDFVVSGQPFLDLIPPKVLSATITGANTVAVNFDEKLNAASALALTNYTLLNTGNSATATQFYQGDSSVVNLAFATTFSSGVLYELAIANVADQSGNVMQPDTVTFLIYIPTKGDVVISELMPDPDPPVLLPNAEYIELYNTRPFPINLKDWKITGGTSVKVIPEAIIPANGYLILTEPADAPAFGALPVLAMDIPSLTNGGMVLSLRSADGMVQDAIEYSTTWYGDPNKVNGGWSLERKDLTRLCSGVENWSASTHPNGGTPGAMNSNTQVVDEDIQPRILSYFLQGDTVLVLRFNQSMDSLSLSDFLSYESPELGYPTVLPIAPLFNSVSLRWASAFAAGTVYHLYLNGLSNCRGTAIANDTLLFGLPQLPEIGDVLLNEILFNPYSDGADFVEMVNVSDRILSFSNLSLANYDSKFGVITSIRAMPSEEGLWFPGKLIAFSTNVDAQMRYYPPDTADIRYMASIPSMPNASGSIAVINQSLEVLDYLEYTEKQHSPVLDDPDGVSLERISLSLSAQDPANWMSAASSVRYATPGYANSQLRIIPAANSFFQVEPKVFTPNLDGYMDFTQLLYKTDRAGYLLNVTIYDRGGFQILPWIRGELLGSEGAFAWDGRDAKGGQSRPDIYIFLIELIHPEGTVRTEKLTCVLSF